jgi:hypothetical protein
MAGNPLIFHNFWDSACCRMGKAAPLFNPIPHCLGNLKSLFCKNENKAWMASAKYFFKIKNASQKIL